MSNCFGKNVLMILCLFIIYSLIGYPVPLQKHKGTGCDVGLVVRRLGLAGSGQEGRRVDLRINDRGNFRGKDLGVVHASPPFDCQSRLFSTRQHAMCAAAGRPISSV